MSTYTQFVSDDATPTDSVAKAPYVPLLDSPAVIDILSRATTRQLNEASSFSDALIKTVGKFFSGALSLADSLGGATFAKLFTDLIAAVDSVAHSNWIMARLYSDSAAVADSISKNPAKSFNEIAIALSDRFSKVANKVVSELFSLADSLFWPSNPRSMPTVDTSVRIMPVIAVGN